MADPPDASASLSKIPHRIAEAYHQQVGHRQASALRAWMAFTITFGLLRLVSYGIRYRFLPLHDLITSGGVHIHHFVWGILLLLLVGFFSLVLQNDRWHPVLALPYGVGAALVVDEFALWLNLRDVYWARQGRLSVDAAIACIALLGIYYAATRFWRQVAGELSHEFGALMHRSPSKPQ